jgi:4'-phosphopantetheinyl transferase
MAESALRDDEIHLWWSSLDGTPSQIDRLRNLLDPSERERADRFRVDAARRRFIAARAALRMVLAATIDGDPTQIEFTLGERGKPSLRGGGPEFNASDSGDFVAVALANSEIGTDIEISRPLKREHQLARRILCSAEFEAWKGLPKDLRNQTLLKLWTCKESILKAAGTGLSGGMTNARVHLRGDGSAESADFRGIQLSLLPIDISTKVIGTIAISAGDWRIIPSRIEFW